MGHTSFMDALTPFVKKHNILYCIVDDTKLITFSWLLRSADIFRKILPNVGTKVVGKCFFRCDFIERNFLEWEWTNKKPWEIIFIFCVCRLPAICWLLTLMWVAEFFLSSFLLHLGEVVGEGSKSAKWSKNSVKNPNIN